MCHQNKLTNKKNLRKKRPKFLLNKYYVLANVLTCLKSQKGCSIVDISHIHMLGGTSMCLFKNVVPHED